MILATRSIILLLVLGLASAVAARGQAVPIQRVQAATQSLRSGNVQAAVDSLQAVTSDYPEFVPAWSALGQAYRSRQEYEQSLDAFRRASERAPENAQYIFQTGVAQALAGNIDAAFEWLGRARDTNAVDMTNVMISPAATVLQDDNRYAELLPSAEDYADPFVEEVRILREWVGEGAVDVFGWIARNIGDVDADGIDDVALSSKAVPETGSRNGKVWVYSSGTGELLWSYTGTIQGGQLGFGIEGAGDVNADGIPDVVAGAPNAAYAMVFNGQTGEVLYEFKSDDPTSAFGISVRGIGDLNGDSHADILIGAPYQIWGQPVNGGTLDMPGFAIVYSGADGSVLLKLAGQSPGDGFGSNVHGKTVDDEVWFIVGAPNAAEDQRGRSYVYRGYTSTPHFVAEADESGVDFGQMFQSVLGDVDGDDVPDIYISDWADSTLGASTGKIYVYSGVDGSLIFSKTGEAAGDGFGIGISDAGDVNDDGHADLIIGAWRESSAAPSGGKIYMYSGADGSLMRQITGQIPGETFGFDTTNVGDVDGDGYIDYLITSAYSSINGWHAGRTFILAGRGGSGR